MIPPELLTLIQTVGAPTTIAVLIVLRLEKRLDRLADAILNLPGDIARRACSNSDDACPFKQADRPRQ